MDLSQKLQLESSTMAMQLDTADMPDMLNFDVTLTHVSTYNQWRNIGLTEGLTTDQEIANFLIRCYDKIKTDGERCVRCGSVFTQLCLACRPHLTPAHTLLSTRVSPHNTSNQSVTTVAENGLNDDPDDADDDESSELASGLLLQDQTVRPHTSGATAQSMEADTELDRFFAPKFRIQNVDFESPETEGVSVKSELELCETDRFSVPKFTAQKAFLTPTNTLDALAVPAEKEKERGCESPETRDRERLQPQAAGRGRPRLYLPSSLVCSVCGRKLSSRQSLFSHMQSQHPLAPLPPALAHLALGAAAKVFGRSGSRKSDKKKRLQKGGARSSMEEEGCEQKGGVRSSTEEEGCEQAVGEEEAETLNISREHAAVGKKKVSTRERLQRRKLELVSLMCQTCGVKCESKRQMYTHSRLCTWKVCYLCGKSVKLLDMHLKRHVAPRRFPCPHCPKSFLFQNYLASHLLYHNDERPFCCEVCGMRYREKTRLNAHLRTHSGVKPFKCEQCPAAFTRPRGLHDHLRVHTGEKPYACQVCARKFSSSGNLAAHRRKVHKLEPQVSKGMARRLYAGNTSSSPPAAQESLETKIIDI